MSATETINATEFGQFLTDLYGLQITATEDASLKCEKFGALATYVDGDGNEKGYILCDLQGAAILGAALTQIPMGAVEDSVSAGALTDNLKENVGEVLNIAVNIFPATSRLVLKDVSVDPASMIGHDEAIGLSLKVQRYGDCRLFVGVK